MAIYWSAESWGDAYPPEDWEEIVDKANEAITAYADANPAATDEEIAEYSTELWERYCSTGNI